MAEEKIRLGGMALANGVLVHGPTAWACAIRTPEGELKVESASKSFRATEVEQPFLRGAARLAEVAATVRSRVGYEVERVTGLPVAAVEVHIQDVRRSA